MSKGGKKIDYLKEDRPITGPPISEQKVMLVSFIEPEIEIAEKKHIYFVNQFLTHEVNSERRAQVDQIVTEVNSRFQKNMERVKMRLQASEDQDDRRLAQAFEELCNKRVSLNTDEVKGTMLRQWSEDSQNLIDKYQTYVIDNHKELTSGFRKMSGNTPDVRGFKVRGVFEDAKSAITKKDEIMAYDDTVDILTAEVGKWNIFNPDARLVGNVEYMGGKYNELNNLMQTYHANREEAKIYHERRREMDKQASYRNRMNSGMKSLLQRRKAKLDNQLNTLQQLETVDESEGNLKNRKKREAKRRRKQSKKVENE